MQAYIAMPKSNAFEVDNLKKLDRASVGFPEHVSYLSLKETKEHAVQTAIQGNRMESQVAAQVTVWYCLGVDMPVHDAFQMVQCGQLVRDVQGAGWRFYSELCFGHLVHTWDEVTLAATGVEA